MAKHIPMAPSNISWSTPVKLLFVNKSSQRRYPHFQSHVLIKLEFHLLNTWGSISHFFKNRKAEQWLLLRLACFRQLVFGGGGKIRISINIYWIMSEKEYSKMCCVDVVLYIDVIISQNSGKY